jgi:hypothetical protein
VIKHTRKHAVWSHPYPGPDWAAISEEPEFMPLSEQRELFSQRIRKLGHFQFLFRKAVSESHIGAAVLPLNIWHIDRDNVTGAYHFPDQTFVSPLRSLLAMQSGIPVEPYSRSRSNGYCQPLPAGGQDRQSPVLEEGKYHIDSGETTTRGAKQQLKPLVYRTTQQATASHPAPGEGIRVRGEGVCRIPQTHNTKRQR